MIPANSKRNINPTYSDVKNAMPKKNKRTGLTDLSNVSLTIALWKIFSSCLNFIYSRPSAHPYILVQKPARTSKNPEGSNPLYELSLRSGNPCGIFKCLISLPIDGSGILIHVISIDVRLVPENSTQVSW